MIQNYLGLVYLLLFASMAIEIALILIVRHSRFPWQESTTSFGVLIGRRLTKILFEGLTFSMYYFAWEHRAMTIPLDSPQALFALFIGIEFCYYWYHRAAHQVRWLWASHVVHHTPQHFNFSVASRLGWTGWLSGNYLFFLPLCWLGFHPIAVVAGSNLNLLYQFWIHTELIPKLGWFEWVFNTPSHHRVHHAANPEYVDRNYGGVLIIFDRLFGTYAEERPELPPRYGLTHQFNSYNPVVVALHEWYRLFGDLSTARSWRERFQIILGSPAGVPNPQIPDLAHAVKS